MTRKTQDILTKERLNLLHRASIDLRFLLSRNYPRKSSISFVGNRYQLSSLERHILYRSVFPKKIAKMRKSKLVPVKSIRGNPVVIDGYNVIITLENGLRGRLLINCDDGLVRDVGKVFRNFKPSNTTQRALDLLAKVLKRYPPSFISIFLDSPYSKSREFSTSLNQWLKREGLSGICKTISLAEKELASKKGIKITADSVMVDHSDRIFDLTGHIVKRVLKLSPIKI